MRKRVVSPGDPSRGVAYIRVSKDEQKLSPVAQRDAIGEWSARNGITVVACFEEQISTGEALAERTELPKAIAALAETRAGLLVVVRRDRLARDVGMALAIESAVCENGARIVSTDGVGNGSGSSDTFVRQILDATAQFERALIRERITAALGAKRKRGEVYGPAPFGFRVHEGRLVLDEREQLIAARIRQWKQEGKTFREIAKAAQDAGFVSRKGKPLGMATIQTVVVGVKQ